MSKFKKGDRVRVESLGPVHEQAGVRVGMAGTVIEDDSHIPYVALDGFTPPPIYCRHLAFQENRLGAIAPKAVRTNILPENDDARAAILLATCLLDYFPNSLAAIAAHSAKSNAKHNPGQPPHWARDKSTGHRDKIVRHLIDAGGFDKDGNRHSTALAWRGLALLEDELIAEGATPGRNAKGSPDALANPQHNCIEDEV